MCGDKGFATMVEQRFETSIHRLWLVDEGSIIQKQVIKTYGSKIGDTVGKRVGDRVGERVLSFV